MCSIQPVCSLRFTFGDTPADLLYIQVGSSYVIPHFITSTVEVAGS